LVEKRPVLFGFCDVAVAARPLVMPKADSANQGLALKTGAGQLALRQGRLTSVRQAFWNDFYDQGG
jgi:hypothetical protein